MTQARRLRRILVTNDDGIDAPGLAVAREVAAQFADEVWVCAPATDCSGMSRLVSLQQPLRIIERGPRTVAVTGSPADCVVIGLRHLMQDNPPDLVLSGVNAGANHSKEIGYSGTIGAALTARMLGVPAVALSQLWITRKDLPWDTSRHWLPQVVTRLVAHDAWPEHAIYNVNVPAVTASEVTGMAVTRLSDALALDIGVDRRVDHRENDYFWLRFQRTGTGTEDDDDTDLAALGRRSVTVTPISLDQTDHALLDPLRAGLGL